MLEHRLEATWPAGIVEHGQIHFARNNVANGSTGLPAGMGNQFLGECLRVHEQLR
jgi:hypothetical protein